MVRADRARVRSELENSNRMHLLTSEIGAGKFWHKLHSPQPRGRSQGNRNNYFFFGATVRACFGCFLLLSFLASFCAFFFCAFFGLVSPMRPMMRCLYEKKQQANEVNRTK